MVDLAEATLRIAALEKELANAREQLRFAKRVIRALEGAQRAQVESRAIVDVLARVLGNVRLNDTNLSQSALAVSLGLNPGSMSRFLSGRNRSAPERARVRGQLVPWIAARTNEPEEALARLDDVELAAKLTSAGLISKRNGGDR